MHLLELYILLQAICSSLAAWTATLEQQLKTKLYTTGAYDYTVRPNHTTDVDISFALFSINELNIVDQSLDFAGYFQIKWLDYRLSWDNDVTYNDVISFFGSSENTWVPGLVIMDSVSSLEVWDDDDDPIRVTSSGRVIWNHIGSFVTSCESDVRYYPFDTQSCAVTITTWGYTNNEISLGWDTSFGEALNMDFYTPNGEWEYKEFSTSVSSVTRGPESYKILSISLNFRRRPLFQFINTILPCVCLAFLGCFVFRLPAESGEKVGFVLTVLLAYAVYLTLVSTNIPTTSITTSAISVYLVLALFVGIVSAILTIYILVAHHNPDDKPIPPWVRQLVGGCMARCCGIKFCRNSAVYNAEVAQAESHKNSAPLEKKSSALDSGKNLDRDLHDDVRENEEELSWQKVSDILDAFFFKVFLIFTLVYQTIFMILFVVGYATQ